MNSKKPQLIFLWPYLEWGGAQIYLIAIIKEAREDWDILVLLPAGSSPDILGLLDGVGVKYEFLDARMDLRPARSFGHRVQRQYARIRSEIVTLRHLQKFDLSKSILHIDVAPWQSWQLFCLLALRRANVFVTLHNGLPDKPAWKRVFWKARMKLVSSLPGFHIFTSNKKTKEDFREFVTETFYKTIKVTYTCVNPPEIEAALNAPFDKAAVLHKHGIPRDKLIVLCVGQFIDRKGRWVFLDAAKKIVKMRKDIAFVWVTSTTPAQVDTKRIESYELDDNFRLVQSGSVGKRHDILQFFRIADIFALPSLLEGLPIALLEAMAMRRPSISSRINAIPEAITHLETGILIAPGKSDELAAAISMLAENDKLRQKLAANGREYVIKHFDERVASGIAIAAYREALSDVAQY